MKAYISKSLTGEALTLHLPRAVTCPAQALECGQSTGLEGIIPAWTLSLES